MNKEWNLKIGDKAYAAAGTSKIRELIKKGKIPPNARIALAGSGNYGNIFELPEFRDFLLLRSNNKTYGLLPAADIAVLIRNGTVGHSALIAQPARPETWHKITKIKAFGKLFKDDAAGISVQQQPAKTPAREKISEKKYNAPPFYYVSLKKLVFLSIFTFGIYDIFWFYKQWKFVKNDSKPGLKPFWRAVLAVFFCDSLFKSIREYSLSKRIYGTYNPELLAIVYIASVFMWRLPDPFGLLTFLGFIPLLFVQNTINKLTADYENESGSTIRGRSHKDIVIVVILFVLAVLGMVGYGLITEMNKYMNATAQTAELQRSELNDIGVSISLPGPYGKEIREIPADMKDVLLENIIYASNTAYISVTIAYFRYSRPGLGIDSAYDNSIGNLANTRGVTDLKHSHEYIEISGCSALKYAAACKVGDIATVAKGLIIINDKKQWSITIPYDPEDNDAEDLAEEILNSVTIQ